jgi:hypothetical protein
MTFYLTKAASIAICKWTHLQTGAPMLKLMANC